MLRQTRTLWILFVIGAAIAYAVLLQPPGCNQTAHYALVQSLAHSTPRIDSFHNETCDTAYVSGHYFAAKAPGLALATAPWFELLRAVRAVPANAALGRGFPAAMLALPRRALWQVGIFGAVLPALGLVFLLRAIGERLSPGSGLPVAAGVGLGTLVFPFATVLFSHVLAASLGLGAFALLFLRQRPLLAGLVAGLAVCVEFPLAVVAVALGLYAWRRAGPYAIGLVAGVVPLLAFNAWAFGDPFRLSYASAVLDPGKSGHDVLGANSSGFFGIGVPSMRVGAELLFSPRGLFLLSPVLLAALGGLWLLYRRGFRREALLAVGIFLAFLVYNAGYYVPFGGYVPGPRFLIASIPFAALGLPAAFTAWPLLTSVLAGFSIAAMTVATAAEPLLGTDDTHSWIARWEHGDFAQSVVTLLGSGHGWIAIAPFLFGVAIAVAAVVPSLTRLHFDGWSVGALLGFVVIFLAAPDLLHTDRAVGQRTGLVTLIALVVALVGVLRRRDRPRLIAGLPLLALVVPGFAAHTKQSLAAVALSIAIVVAVELRGRFSG